MSVFHVSPDIVLNVDGEAFLARIPLPRGRIEIDVRVSEYLRGQPLQSIPADTYDFARMIATLNYVIYKKPAKYEEVKDWGQYYDLDLVLALWEEYRTKQNEYLEKLKKNNTPGLPEGRGNDSGSVSNGEIPETAGSAGHVPPSKEATTGGGRMDGQLGFSQGQSAGHPASPRARVRPERPT